MLPETLSADPFPPVDDAAWRAVVERDLKGADFARRLVHRTLDGLEVHPLYSTGPDRPPLPIDPSRLALGWERCQVVDHPHPVRANEALLEDLGAGATGVCVRLDDAARIGDRAGVARGGVAVHAAADLDAVLAGVHLDAAPVHLDAGLAGPTVAGWLEAIWAQRGVDAPLASLGLDPLGDLAAGGRGGDPAGAVAWVARTSHLPGVTALAVRTQPWHHAGASHAQTLGFALAGGVAHLRAAEAVGIGAAEVARSLVFHVAVDSAFFQAVCGLRALRLAWRRVQEACGVDPVPARVHVTVSRRVLTRHDPWVNLLRNTAAVFAGAIGGADVVTSVPFDRLLGQPSPLARRLARNTASILLEESHLHRISDPMAGSWFVESHTAELAEAAWGWLQRVETAGGLAAALHDGKVAVWCAESADARAVDLAKRKQPVIGVSAYADLHEELPVPPAVDVGPIRERVDRPLTVEPTLRAEPLPERRDAAPFEDLRATAPAGRVFLANLGPLARHVGRATWLTNLLAAGGVAVVDTDGFDDAAAASAAFAASGCTVAAICGSDGDYASSAGQLARALRSAGARRVLLAGRVKGQQAALRDAGVDDFVYLGRDVPEVLRGVHTALEAR